MPVAVGAGLEVGYVAAPVPPTKSVGVMPRVMFRLILSELEGDPVGRAEGRSPDGVLNGVCSRVVVLSKYVVRPTKIGPWVEVAGDEDVVSFALGFGVGAGSA